jgi:CubicO group peptidase (beta-lactamase class C family)
VIASGYERVAEAFEENFRSHGDVGAAVCVYVDGEPVVDLVGGTYTDDTLQFVFSTTKGITALAVLGLVRDGVFDLDAPIADVWPEFAAHDKHRITLRHVLGHRAGIPVIDGDFTIDDLLDVDVLDRALEQQTPLWEPGTAHGYHALTYGWIIDGVFRRATGQSVSEHVQARITAVLDLDLAIGTPASLHARVTPALDMPPLDIKIEDLEGVLPPDAVDAIRSLLDPDSLANRAVYINGALKPADGSLAWNDPRVWSAAWPAATGITNARSLARMYAAAIGPVDGVTLLDDAGVKTALTELSYGPDRTTMFPSRFGHGFHLHHDLAPLLSDASFGHGGMGGSQAFADVDHHVGFAYVMNQMQLVSDRASALVNALRQCL